MKYAPIILLYNNDTHLPFLFSSILQSNGWTISSDKSLMQKAAVIVFHLPTLHESIAESLEKQEGQVWVGWRQTNEFDIRSIFESVWEDIFDFYLDFPFMCYWECATTYGRNTLSIAKSYNLLENVISLCRKVDFMLIGTQKGGTTALHEYLHQHPSCWGSFFKEPGFFLYPNIYKMGLSWYIGWMWKERSPLRFSQSHCLLFESSTWYSFWHEVPHRLYEYNPDLKLIFIVRNPIERAFSQYNMLIHWSKEKLLYEYSLYIDKGKLNELIDQLLDVKKYPFSYWIDLEISKIGRDENNMVDFFPDFLYRGIYYDQLVRYYSCFKKDNILIVENGELKNNRIGTLHRIEQFLNIPWAEWRNMDLEEKFTSRYDASLPEPLRKRMRAFFKPYNEKLFHLIDKDYRWE